MQCWRVTTILLTLFAGSAAVAQEPNSLPLPQVAVDWKIELIAAAPVIHAPTAVVESRDGTIYLGQDPMDMNGPPTVPHDSVVTLKWRDGKLVKTVFADKLWAVMGLELIGETLYVVHAPFLSAFRDTDGDGRADERVDLVTGLGPKLPAFSGYNDHVPSGMRIGMDGFLYLSVGDKGIPRAVGRDGQTISLRGGGVVRVRPDGTDLEIVSTGLRNPLSATLSSFDDVFTYGNDDDSKKFPNSLIHNIDGGHYGYPYEFLTRPHLCLPIITGEMGGAGTQGFCFNEDGLATQFRGNLFFCDFGRQTLDRFEVEPVGGTYRLKRRTNIVSAGKLGSFRPFSAAVGGDGNSVLVTDWTQPGQLVTGATSAGRLFRLTYHGTDAIQPGPLAGDADGLQNQLSVLDHLSRRERLKAQRALVETGEGAVPALARLLNAGREAENNGYDRLHALWALDAIGGKKAETAILKAVDDDDPTLRTQAIRAVGIRQRQDALSQLIAHLQDKHATVRREAAIALGRIEAKEAVDHLLARVGDTDRFTAWSLRRALKRIGHWDAEQLAAAVLKSEGERRRQLLVLMEDVWNVEVVKAWCQIARDAPEEPATLRHTAYRMLANLYHKYPEWKGFWFGPNPLAGRFPERTEAWSEQAERLILATLSDGLASIRPSDRLAVIAALEVIGTDAAPSLVKHLKHEGNAKLRHATLVALSKTGTVGASETLGHIAGNGNEQPSVRMAAVVVLARDKSKGSTEQLSKLAGQTDATDSLVALALPELARRGALDEARLLRFLRSNDRAEQIAGLEALAVGVVTSSAIETRVVALLSHDNHKVQSAAIKAVTSHRYRSASSRLIQFHEIHELTADVEAALLVMPTPDALDIYLAGLASASSSHRQSCTEALLAICDEVTPKLKALATQGRAPASALPALQRVLTRFESVNDWQVIGPFPRQVPDSLYQSNPDYSKRMAGAEGRTVGWKPEQADAVTGTLALNDYKSGAGDTGGFGYENTGTNYVSLFAHATIESPADRDALLLIGSSGSLDVRVNGRQVYRFSNLSGRPFVADEAIAPIKLSKGRNSILVRSYSGIGRWRFAVRVSSAGQSLLPIRPTKLSPDELRKFALANDGDADRGKLLFFDQKRIACAKCHAVAGTGGRIGPDLAGFAVKYDRAEAIRSILEPSQRLATGYVPVLVATESGRVVTGLVKSETSSELELVDTEGRITRVSKDEIEARRVSQTSIMPNGLAATVTKEDFADLIEYLTTLKSVPKQGAKK